MPAALFGLRIDSGPVLVVVYAVAIAAVLVLLARRPTRRWVISAGGAAVGGVVLGYLTSWVIGDELDVFGFALTPVTDMWVGFLTGGMALVVVNLVLRTGWRRVVAGVCAPVIVLACGAGLNADAGAYTSVRAALGVPSGVTLSASGLPRLEQHPVPANSADWHPQSPVPRRGELLSVAIPGTVSRFHARAAEVYLPPAALVRNAPALPVLVAFSGQPGSPMDLFNLGHLALYLNAYARQHDGVAPIVISPDQLGTANPNPMCVDSPLGNVATYVTTDVVQWALAHLNVERGASNWGLLGFSEGATCSNQFLAGYPQLFSAELSISSELRPSDGANTVHAAFHGSEAAYAAAAPEALMRAHRAELHHSYAEFAVGGDDTQFRPYTKSLAAAARRAGMTVTVTVAPGSAHDWNTVRYALSHDLPPLIDQLCAPA